MLNLKTKMFGHWTYLNFLLDLYSAVHREVGTPPLDQTKDCEIGICCFIADMLH